MEREMRTFGDKLILLSGDWGYLSQWKSVPQLICDMMEELKKAHVIEGYHFGGGERSSMQADVSLEPSDGSRITEG